MSEADEDRDWLEEIRAFQRSALRLGTVAWIVLTVTGTLLARMGMWVQVPFLMYAAVNVGFGIGLLVASLRRTDGQR